MLQASLPHGALGGIFNPLITAPMIPQNDHHGSRSYGLSDHSRDLPDKLSSRSPSFLSIIAWVSMTETKTALCAVASTALRVSPLHILRGLEDKKGDRVEDLPLSSEVLS